MNIQNNFNADKKIPPRKKRSANGMKGVVYFPTIFFVYKMGFFFFSTPKLEVEPKVDFENIYVADSKSMLRS